MCCSLVGSVGDAAVGGLKSPDSRERRPCQKGHAVRGNSSPSLQVGPPEPPEPPSKHQTRPDINNWGQAPLHASAHVVIVIAIKLNDITGTPRESSKLLVCRQPPLVSTIALLPSPLWLRLPFWLRCRRAPLVLHRHLCSPWPGWCSAWTSVIASQGVACPARVVTSVTSLPWREPMPFWCCSWPSMALTRYT